MRRMLVIPLALAATAGLFAPAPARADDAGLVAAMGAHQPILNAASRRSVAAAKEFERKPRDPRRRASLLAALASWRNAIVKARLAVGRESASTPPGQQARILLLRGLRSLHLSVLNLRAMLFTRDQAEVERFYRLALTRENQALADFKQADGLLEQAGAL